MIVCDYTNDIGYVFRRVRPVISGRNLSENQLLSPAECLTVISNWVDVDDYYEVGDKEAGCPSYGRFRKIIYQDKSHLIEVEYPKPLDIDWTALESEPVKIRTVPEFINHPTATMLLKLKY